MNDTAAQPAAPQAAPAAPEAAGQGAESTDGNELYSPFLEGVPEDIHETVLSALKAQNAEFTKKFQSNSERTKPFEELGIFDQKPETIGAFLQLDQAMQAAEAGDEQAKEAVYKWWDQVGDALKFYDEDGPEGAQGSEDEDFDVMDLDKNAFDKAVEEKVKQIVGPLEQQFQSQQTKEQEAAEREQIKATVEGWTSEVLEANPGIFDGEDGAKVKEEVMELAVLFPDSENPVQAGLEKYRSLVGSGEANLFQKKQEQAKPAPEGAGRADTTPRKIRTFEEAREAAEEYLANGNSITP